MSQSTFPRSHAIIAAVLTLALSSFIASTFGDDPERDRYVADEVMLALHSPDAAPARDHFLGLTPESVPESLVLPPAPAEPSAAAEVPVERIEPQYTRTTVKVRPGDSLAAIFKRQGHSPREVHEVATSGTLGKRLRSIFPGHEFVFATNDAGALMKLTYSPGPLETLEFERTGDSFVGREVIAEPERIRSYKHGTIEHSLFIASQRAGLSDGLTMRLAQIFQWDIDFVLDIRSGDEFHVVFEELYLGKEFVGYGDVLAAEFVNRGQSYHAVLFEEGDGDTSYFAPDGTNMRKAFLRAPVEFSRISSNFNLRRKHPLHKTTRPHRGIDYAAPSGTPILAAGDGRVKSASRSSANGNFVILQHGEQFVTKYLHLSKFAKGVRSGGKVKQGQTIGYVGATGWATGPHLHYEFLENGVHRNPRTVSLPDAAPINKNDRERFDTQARPLLAKLEEFKTQIQVAAAR